MFLPRQRHALQSALWKHKITTELMNVEVSLKGEYGNLLWKYVQIHESSMLNHTRRVYIDFDAPEEI